MLSVPIGVAATQQFRAIQQGNPMTVQWTEKLAVHAEDGIGWLTLNQPEKRNALSLVMWRDLPRVMTHFEADPAVRVVVVRGAGDKAFSAGADISEFGTVRATPADRKAYDRTVADAFDAMRNLPKLSIAMIDGVCVGGGAEVAMECDIQIASTRSRFAVTPARLGLGYNLEDTARLVRNVGAKHAKEILATARFYSAAEARDMGWINRVVDAEALDSYVRDYAASVAVNAPLSVRAAKLIINELQKDSAEQNHDECGRLVEACFESADYQEGQAAFAEKRPPRFKGA
jgi:enoyl-CoA hydratase/carnithine racemase